MSDHQHELDEAAKPVEDDADMLQHDVDHLGDDIAESRRKLDEMPKPNDEPLEGV